MAINRNQHTTLGAKVNTSAPSRFRLSDPAQRDSFSDADSEGGDSVAILRTDEPGLEQALADLNRTHAVVRLDGRTLVLEETIDHLFGWKKVVYSSFSDFQNFYNKHKISVPRGKTQEQLLLGEEWIKWDKRRQYKGAIFDPSNKLPADYFNLWQGFSVEPCKGDWSFYEEHMFSHICNGDQGLFNYVKAWMAQGVQQPHIIPQVAIVLKSGRGAGKGTFAENYMKLFGRHGKPFSQMDHVFGRFNSHLEDTIAVVLQEGFFNGNKNWESNLKSYITDDILSIEPKGLAQRNVKNYLRFMFLSNEQWIVPAGADERRYLVLEIPKHRYTKNTTYFGRIHEEMESGGRAAMLYDLQRYDYKGIDIRSAPATEALTEQKLRSLDAKSRWWYERLSDGCLGSGRPWGEVDKDALTGDFVEYLKAARWSRERHGGAVELGIFLKKMVPNLRDRRTKEPTFGLRRRVWGFPSLEICREEFEKNLEAKINWPETEESSSLHVVAQFREGGKT